MHTGGVGGGGPGKYDIKDQIEVSTPPLTSNQKSFPRFLSLAKLLIYFQTKLLVMITNKLYFVDKT